MLKFQGYADDLRWRKNICSVLFVITIANYAWDLWRRRRASPASAICNTIFLTLVFPFSPRLSVSPSLLPPPISLLVSPFCIPSFSLFACLTFILNCCPKLYQFFAFLKAVQCSITWNFNWNVYARMQFRFDIQLWYRNSLCTHFHQKIAFRFVYFPIKKAAVIPWDILYRK